MKRLLLGLSVGAAILAAFGGCDAEGNRKGMVITPGMIDSIPYDAYDENPLGGQTLRLAPEGTVPYGARRYHYGPTPEEAVRAGAELDNPIDPTPENLARGRDRYETFCLTCHGASGAGDGPIIGRVPAPPPYDVRAKTLPDGHLFHIITYGQGLMGSYAVQVRQDDRWRIIHYIRTLQGIAPGSVPRGIPRGTGAGGGGGEGGQGGAGGGAGGEAAGGAGQGGAAGGEPGDATQPSEEPEAPVPPPPPAPAPKPVPPPRPAPPGDPYD